MKKWMGLGGLLLAAALVASGCGGKTESSPSPSEAAGGGEKQSFTVEATNFKFEPGEIKVKQGDEVSITLKNAQGNHDLKIEGYDKVVKGNATVTFVADKTGEFKFICSIFCGKGHDDMIGKLFVE